MAEDEEVEEELTEQAEEIKEVVKTASVTFNAPKSETSKKFDVIWVIKDKNGNIIRTFGNTQDFNTDLNADGEGEDIFIPEVDESNIWNFAYGTALAVPSIEGLRKYEEGMTSAEWDYKVIYRDAEGRIIAVDDNGLINGKLPDVSDYYITIEFNKETSRAKIQRLKT